MNQKEMILHIILEFDYISSDMTYSGLTRDLKWVQED